MLRTLRFELKVAWRHLVTSHGQTHLTVGAVAVGVLLVVFLSSLINGLQTGLIEDVVGSIPHITIEAANPGATPLWQVPGHGHLPGQIVTKVEQMSTRKQKVEQWRRLAATIESLPGVRAVAPTAQGGGLAARGVKKIGAFIVGIIPSSQAKVVSIKSRVVEGDINAVDQQNVAIGVKMASELGAGLGNRIRVASNEGVVQTFRVACIFDLGSDQVNESYIYMGLPAAQALLKMGKEVTTLNVRTRSLFDAEHVADQIRNFTGMKVVSWMESNRPLLDTLNGQHQAAAIIQAMTLLASAFGVASAMIVFVVQKSKDIGILKSMGATARQIEKIFLLEGLGVGLGGAVLGSLVGTGLCFLASNVYIPGQVFGGKPATIVPMQWDIKYALAASGVAVFVGLFSSLMPARRAAKLHPVEAIRHG